MKMHTIIIEKPIFHPEAGLLLGNGDISVSVSQQPEAVVLNFGKGDLWDTRLDVHRNPRPADIEELRKLVLAEDIHCDGPSGKLRMAAHSSARLADLCVNRALANSAPNPKPGAKLIIHYCGDLRGLKLRQTLTIERGIIELTLSWDNGVSLDLALAVHPTDNRLRLRWQVGNWDDGKRFGGSFYGIVKPYPVFFELIRPAEKPIGIVRREILPLTSTTGVPGYAAADPLLPPARPALADGAGLLTQDLPDRQYTAAVTGTGLEYRIDGDALLLLPQTDSMLSGELRVGFSISDTQEALQLARFDGDDFGAAAAAARAFFAVSHVHFDEPLLERLWYASMHAKRCVFRADRLPPGLLLPSTLTDYSSWHGDYHLNYNYQSAFLGDFTAGHFDTGDALFTGLRPLLKLGRKIAGDYYHCRGCFVQLSGFPFETDDDYLGNLPFGRMAYMTGWVAAWFYRRWDLSRDRRWLTETGYPALRDFALFYTDFLTLEADGRYHAFPSNQGEEDYSLAGTRDQPQVMRHARRALEYASECAAELDTDGELRQQWQTILRQLAPEAALPIGVAAEFAGFDGGEPAAAKGFLCPGTKYYDWYPGQVPYFLMTALRNRRWDSRKDAELLLNFLRRWLLPNGLLQAMPVTHYGHEGFWSEGLGIAGGLTDMLIQNRAGILEFFPEYAGDGEFDNLLVEGGWRCGAARRNRRITELSITAGESGVCRVRLPWTTGFAVCRNDGKCLKLNADTSNCVEFPVFRRQSYILSCSEKNEPSNLSNGVYFDHDPQTDPKSTDIVYSQQ